MNLYFPYLFVFFWSSAFISGQFTVPELVSNLEFGGVEGNILYITATTSLYSIELNQQGARFYE